MFDNYVPNCCPTCNRAIDSRDMDFVNDTAHFFTRYECPHCEHGCYLVLENDDETITYDCCYCHKQPE